MASSAGPVLDTKIKTVTLCLVVLNHGKRLAFLVNPEGVLLFAACNSATPTTELGITLLLNHMPSSGRVLGGSAPPSSPDTRKLRLTVQFAVSLNRTVVDVLDVSTGQMILDSLNEAKGPFGLSLLSPSVSVAFITLLRKAIGRFITESLLLGKTPASGILRLHMGFYPDNTQD